MPIKATTTVDMRELTAIFKFDRYEALIGRVFLPIWFQRDGPSIQAANPSQGSRTTSMSHGDLHGNSPAIDIEHKCSHRHAPLVALVQMLVSILEREAFTSRHST